MSVTALPVSMVEHVLIMRTGTHAHVLQAILVQTVVQVGSRLVWHFIVEFTQ